MTKLLNIFILIRDRYQRLRTGSLSTHNYVTNSKTVSCSKTIVQLLTAHGVNNIFGQLMYTIMLTIYFCFKSAL